MNSFELVVCLYCKVNLVLNGGYINLHARERSSTHQQIRFIRAGTGGLRRKAQLQLCHHANNVSQKCNYRATYLYNRSIFFSGAVCCPLTPSTPKSPTAPAASPLRQAPSCKDGWVIGVRHSLIAESPQHRSSQIEIVTQVAIIAFK